MDTIEAIGASGSNGATGAIPAAQRGFGALDADEFTRIILTELSNQDPLEPNDTSALLDQLSTIRSIESDTQLNTTLGRLVDRSDFTAAAGLIGFGVQTSAGGDLTQTVTSVSQTSEGVSVTLDDGTSVPLSSVLRVLGPTPTEVGA
jgi:flagellar basal-body rod modification protein FlgD